MTESFLCWQDIAKMFQCGRSKAFLIMQEVGVIYIGRTPLVSAARIEEHLQEYGEIRVSWSSLRR